MKAPEIQWNPKVTPQATFYLKTHLLRKTGFKKEHVFDLTSKIVSLKVKMYNFQIFQCFKMPYMKSITLHIPYISKIFEIMLKPSNIKKRATMFDKWLSDVFLCVFVFVVWNCHYKIQWVLYLVWCEYSFTRID